MKCMSLSSHLIDEMETERFSHFPSVTQLVSCGGRNPNLGSPGPEPGLIILSLQAQVGSWMLVFLGALSLTLLGSLLMLPPLLRWFLSLAWFYPPLCCCLQISISCPVYPKINWTFPPGGPKATSSTPWSQSLTLPSPSIPSSNWLPNSPDVTSSRKPFLNPHV